MTEEQISKRSRRRFLADMLFLGGGITAAALVAKNKFSTPEPDPNVMGAMEIPTDLKSPPMPGEPMPPQIEGEVEMPEACPSPSPAVDGDYVVAPAPPREPALGGKPVAPKTP